MINSLILIITITFLVIGYLIVFELPNASLTTTVASPSKAANYSPSSNLLLPSNDSSTDNLNRTNAGELQVRYTGIIRSDISPEVARSLGLNETYPGLIVTEVLPDSPAEKAGLRGANQVKAIEGEIISLGGDIIVSVDGNQSAVEDRQAFIDYLQNEKAFGDNITLTFLRDGNTRQANLTITPMPNYFWYNNLDEGIRMKYPSDWDVVDTNLGRGDIIAFFSPEFNADRGRAMASVSVRVIPSGGATLDELALREEAGTPDTRPLDVKGKELAGQQAYESVFYDYGANGTRKAKSTFTIKDDQIYTINYFTDPSRYDDYLPMVEEMIRSFRFE